jgi:hypothetical protein
MFCVAEAQKKTQKYVWRDVPGITSSMRDTQRICLTQLRRRIILNGECPAVVCASAFQLEGILFESQSEDHLSPDCRHILRPASCS